MTDVDTDVTPEPVLPTPPATPTARTFTAEEVEKFRADERNKLQSKLDATNAKLAEIAEAQAVREAADAEAAAATAAATKAAAEADLDAKQLLDVRQAEWEKKFSDLQEEQRQREALLAHERHYLEMKAYIQGRVAEEAAAKTVHPAFYDYIDGATTEEIEASIQLAKAKTEQMVQEIAARETGRTAAALQAGGGVTTRTGPTDFGTVTETADGLDPTQMSYAEFVKNRNSLIKTNSNSGIFG